MFSFFDTIGWHPSIGDPSLVGWFTVFAYFYTAFKCWTVVQNAGPRFGRTTYYRERSLWVCACVLLLVLGINKQLDLQSFFTAAARYISLEQGWYGQRRALQVYFIWAIAIAGISVAMALAVFFRSVIARHWLVVLGLCWLFAFVFIRASSFHNMDWLIGQAWLGIYANWVLELGGIFMVWWNARTLLGSGRRRHGTA